MQADSMQDPKRHMRLLLGRHAVTGQRLAAVAQLVERVLGKDEVSGPNPDSSSASGIHFVYFIASHWYVFLVPWRVATVVPVARQRIG